MKLLAIALVGMLWLAIVGCGEEATPVAAPVDETASVVSFMTEDGVELKGRLFGDGEVGIVLSHMYPEDQSSWWGFAQVLSENAYMTLTFDFRGYGESGGDKEIQLIDRDVKAAHQFLRDRGASTLFFVGASMGGTASLKVAAGQAVDQAVAGVVSLSGPIEFHGLSLKGEQVRVPVLLMATKGDGSAKNNLESLVDDGIAGALTETVVYDEGKDHGTDMLKGGNAGAARGRILGFLEAHAP